MDIAERDKMIDELHIAADELFAYLPAEDINCFKELVDHSEIGVGLEILLTQIDEYDLIIPKKTYNILKNCGRGHIDDCYCDRIKYTES